MIEVKILKTFKVSIGKETVGRVILVHNKGFSDGYAGQNWAFVTSDEPGEFVFGPDEHNMFKTSGDAFQALLSEAAAAHHRVIV